ncbi:hypothetical protein [Acinetobacter guerrae]|uniref:hypothetical protein n=1 Tax=Acinetobacter guerrae TaxID=1843371 RepID=UPI00148F34F5|nr:hypothetical protein [Acinetobacter guerrae]
MDKCKEEFEETFKKLNKISLSDHAVIFGYPKREEAFFNAAWQEQQKRIDELTVGCGLQRDHIKGLEAELKKAWTTVDQEGHKKHGLVMLLKFIKEHFEMNDLDKAMPRVYEELEQALKGGGA